MLEANLSTARILIVDDQDANILLLERILSRADYDDVVSTSDPTKVLDLCNAYQPDIILLDLRMPGMDGYEVLGQLREARPRDEYLPVLVLTADATRDAKRRALEAGARDFLTKPFDTTEVVLRIRNLLETRQLYSQLRRQNETLEARVQERTQQLEQAQLEILDRLARAAEFRDDTTGQHTQRVGRTAAILAESIGLPRAQIELIRRAAPLHDIGKIGIPDHLLLKPGRLSPEEHDRMKTHTIIGGRLLAGSTFPLLNLAQEIAQTHHERWNGEGYPNHLEGDEIPVAGRVAAVADVFDALIHERPYKHAWPVEDAIKEISTQAGHQFDPDVVAEFHHCLPEVLAPLREQGTGNREQVGSMVGNA